MSLTQMNLNDPRVKAWYAAVDRHSEDCSREKYCLGCEKLKQRRQKLYSIPGILVEVSA